MTEITIFEHPHMSHPAHDHKHSHPHPHAEHQTAQPTPPRSVLAWPAWLRVLAVLPVVVVLWLAVVWANAGVMAW